MTSGQVKTERQNLRWIIAVEDGLHFADVVFLRMGDVRGLWAANCAYFSLCCANVFY